MENKRKGWIKIHRAFVENPYMVRPAYVAVWIRLLIEAEHGMIKDSSTGKFRKKKVNECSSIIWKGKQTHLKAGQLTCGVKQLSAWTGVAQGTVYRVLKTFKNEEMIEEQTSSKFSLITINNWGKYQQDEEHFEEPVKNQRRTSEEPVKTLEECNNEKNVNNEEDKICEILKIEDENIKTLIKDLIIKYKNKDAESVAYKLALKTKNSTQEQTYLMFTSWLGREYEKPKVEKKTKMKFINL